MIESSHFRRHSTVAWILALGVTAALAGQGFAGPAGADDPVRQARERFEASVGPLDPAAYRAEPVADEDNAAHWFLAGATALDLSPDDQERLSSLVERLPESWSATETAWLRQVVTREEAALELLHRGADCTASAFPAIPADTELDPTPLLDLRRASRLLLAAGLLELEERTRSGGDAPVRALDTLGALSDSLAAQPEMLYLLFGVATQGDYLLALHHAVESPGTPPALLRSLEGRLGDRSASEAFADSIALTAAEAARRITESDEPGSAAAEASLLDELRLMVEAARDPAGATSHLDATTAEPDSVGKVVTALLVPNLWETLVRLQATEAARQLARAAVAARLEAAARGAYPRDVTLEPDPYTATAPEYTRFPDGSALLANPAAAAAWTQRTSGENLPGLPFHWHLPAE